MFENNLFKSDDFENKNNEVSKFETKERLDGVISKIDIYDNLKYKLTKDIILTNDGGKVNFSDFLPKGHIFYDSAQMYEFKESRDTAHFSHDSDNRRVNFSHLEREGSLLALLHEIGHSNIQNSDKPNDFRLNKNKLYEYANQAESRSLTEDKIRERGESIEDYQRVVIYDPELDDWPFIATLVPKAIVKEYDQDWAKNERDAWAFALQKIRKIRQSGIEIETSFSDLDSLKTFIYNALGTYDEKIALDKLDQNQHGDKSKPFTKGKSFKKMDISSFDPSKMKW